MATNTVMPVFIGGYPAPLSTLLSGQAVQIVFGLTYRLGSNDRPYLLASLVTVAAV